MSNFHEHVCPECDGYWSHQEDCGVAPGDLLPDPDCEAKLIAEWDEDDGIDWDDDDEEAA